MSKKDFHPSAIWNLKKVFMAQQKQSLDKKKQDELRAAYDKEQEILNNKALLGDEKARLGLAFMYDPPAGIKKEEKEITPAIEPKFEWQRKYNAPREDWAKGDDSIADQPFGIQVRNVRCVKCHTWGHINTDRECKLYNMSGNHEDPGLTTNPSDIIREMKKGKSYSCNPPADFSDQPGPSGETKKREKLNPEDLMTEMRTEYGLSLKPHIVDRVRTDEALKKMESKTVEVKTEKDEKTLMFDFLQGLSEKERAKIFNKFFDSSTEPSKKKSKKHHKKDKKEKKKKRRRSRSRSRS